MENRMNSKMITKVEYKKDKLVIQWHEIRDGHVDKKSIESRVEPHEDLFNALRALDRPLCIEAELEQDENEYKRHDIQVLNVEYDENEKDGSIVMSASITSERHMELTMERMKIVSPMKPEVGEFGLDSLTVKTVEEVIKEAEAYLGGKRHDLFSMTDKQKELVND